MIAVHGLAGRTISIDLKERSYFGVPGTPIWLTPTRYWCQVPSDLPVEAYEAIHRGLESGAVILGKEYLPPVDQVPGTQEWWWQLLRPGLTHDVVQAFRRLIGDGHDGGHTAFSILNYCKQQHDASGRRNPAITIFLEDELRLYQGPVEMCPQPTDKEGLKCLDDREEE